MISSLGRLRCGGRRYCKSIQSISMNIHSVVHLDKLLTVNLNQVLSRFGFGGLRKLARTIDLACRVFIPRDSLGLLSESWSLTDASLSAIGITVVRERGR